MRVGIDASNLRGGGGLTHLREILRAADPSRDGFEAVTVWAGRRTLNVLPSRPWLIPSHQPLLDQPLPMRMWWRRSQLPELANKRCDILFVPGGGVTIEGVQCVTMSRNVLPFEEEERRRFGWSFQRVRLEVLRWLQARGFESADGLIFLSEYARDLILPQLRSCPQRSAIIPHGVADRFRFSPCEQKKLSAFTFDDPFRLLYVSTINEYKHQWNLVYAAGALREAGLPVALDLVGRGYGPALDKLRIAMDSVDPNGEFVRYHGLVPYDCLHEWYARADAFVFASTAENMPNSLLEAMAAGLPVASSDRGPMPEIIGEFAWYFDPEEPDEIARALNEMLCDPGTRQTAAVGANRIAAEYTWTRCAERTFEFLRAIDDQ